MRFDLRCRWSPRPRLHPLLTAVSLAGFTLLDLGTLTPRAAEGSNHSSQPLPVAPTGRVGFARLPASATQVHFTNSLAQARSTTNQIHLNGSGVAAGDVDGDGRCDLYFCGLDGPNALYRNLGNWTFEETAEKAGVACPGWDCTGAAFADLDGDGDLDLIVNTIGTGTALFTNNGAGRFSPVHPSPTLNLGRGAMSLALADYDGDGDLDVYVVNYRIVTVRDQPSIRIKGEYVQGKPVVASVDDRPASDPAVAGRFTLEPTGKILEHGEVDVLLRNDGNGRWTPVSFTEGTFSDEHGKPLAAPPYEWGLSAMFRDINGDGAPDLYVCNDFRSPDRFWLNDGHGRFRSAPRLTLRHTSLFSMGADFADVDRDGRDDLFVADMLSRDYIRRQVQVGELAPAGAEAATIESRPQYSHNTLLHQRDDGTFAEIAWFSGVQASEWSWCPIFLDVDLDGWEDLLVSNGHERDAMNADVMQQAERAKKERRLSPTELLRLNHLFDRLATPNVAFRNKGDLTFEDVSAAWGLATPGVSHGMALADLDGDGDLDLAMNNLNGPAGLYRNESDAGRIQIRLRGARGNRFGIGARIILHGGAVPHQSQEMIAGGRYLSSDEPVRVFATGKSAQPMRVEVVWPSGARTQREGLRANHLYEIAEPEPDSTAASTKSTKAKPTEPSAWFEDVTASLGHVHRDDDFRDEERQPLVARRLSRLGPGVAWIDVDGDGREDLVVAGGKGGEVRAYQNAGHGPLREMTNAPWRRPLARDVIGLAGWEGIVVAAQAHYEEDRSDSGSLRIYDGKRRASGDSIRGEVSSPGPIALADVDADGDLDVFLGGRAVGGRYPEPADSLLLRNDGGKLVPWQRWEKLGLVSGAVFSDVNGDGTPELILACEWGPIRLFERVDGSFREATARWGLASTTGWWNGVTTGDLNNDGRLDVVATNWGLNSRYRATAEHPLRVYFGDLGGDGRVSILETQWDQALQREVLVRNRKALVAALPGLTEVAPSHARFAQMRVEELFGDSLKRASRWEASHLASAVFFNRGDRFEREDLPREAQWAPAYGVNIADADGDGNDDVFLSQNFFSQADDDTRQDAGRGLWLRGDGTGRLVPMNAGATGIALDGEQRGSATCDFDADGRIDLAVGQNGAPTRLFRNVGGRPGLRVRLLGQGANFAGIGATIQVRSGNRWGPLREMQAGSGYASQNSAIQVFGLTGNPQTIRVRWPGGQVTESEVDPGLRDITVAHGTGRIKVAR